MHWLLPTFLAVLFARLVQRDPLFLAALPHPLVAFNYGDLSFGSSTSLPTTGLPVANIHDSVSSLTCYERGILGFLPVPLLGSCRRVKLVVFQALS